jgi:rSAM/selenodomain-associated transferase 1
MGEAPVFAQMARQPIPGRVKTRLLPYLSPQQAAQLHAAMVEHVCKVLCAHAAGRCQLWVDGDPQAELFRRCYDFGLSEVLVQPAGDLGQRMAHACQRGVSEQGAIVLVGSDSPAIDADYLAAAERALEQVDVVVGPALDGGYVLLGMRRFSAALFEGIAWGTGTVLAETLAVLQQLRWTYRLLSPLPDIDRPEDLRLLPDTIRASVHGLG